MICPSSPSSWRLAALIVLSAVWVVPATVHAQLDYATPYSFTTYSGAIDNGSADGTGTAARFKYPQGVAVDGSGNVYVADTSNHTIRKITPTGVVTTLAGSPGQAGNADGIGSAARFSSPKGIATDASGNVYVSSDGCVRKITSAAVVTTLAGNSDQWGALDGSGTTARFWPLFDLAVDPAGNVVVADFYNHTIRRITPAGDVTTLAGLAGAAGNTDGTGNSARFNQPHGVAVDGAGNAYVSDRNNHTIRKITPAGVVTTFAGSAGTTGSTDGVGTAARFNSPAGLGIDSAGNVFVADAGNQIIRKITPAGAVTKIAGLTQNVGSADGTGANATFYNPQDVTADNPGNLFVADNHNHSIRKISSAQQVTTFAGPNRDTLVGDNDGTLGTALFRLLNSIALGPNREIYLADGARVRKVSADGVVSTLAGLPRVIGSTDGTGTNALFSLIEGIAVDSAGNALVADSLNHTIRKVTAAGVVTTIAGQAGFAGAADGTGNAARFNRPAGLALDSAGNLFVADNLNGAIRKVTPAGVVTTIGGLLGQPGLVDGPAGSARLNSPSAVALDSFGNIMVSDGQGIRIVSTTGSIATYAGVAVPPNFSLGTPPTDGPGISARFNQIKALAIDRSNHLYVAGSTTGLVRKITPPGLVTTLAGSTNAGTTRDGVGRDATFEEVSGIAVDADGTLYVTGPTSIHKGQLAGTPVITVQPQSQTVAVGGNVSFSVAVTGAPDPTYQWYFNGNPFVGATASTLNFSNVRSSDAGDYTVVVTNALGSVTSSRATLSIGAATPPPSSGGSSGGGGGGGAPSLWFILSLFALLIARDRRQRPRARLT